MDIKDLCENHKVMIVMTPQQLKEFALSIIKDVKADEKKKEDARNADRIMTSREAYTSLRLYFANTGYVGKIRHD